MEEIRLQNLVQNFWNINFELEEQIRMLNRRRDMEFDVWDLDDPDDF